MIYIAHRGNTNGANPEKENEPYYVKEALDKGFHCEIDVWYQNGTWYLGHDEPQYGIAFDFLLSDNLWLHCKNIDALARLKTYWRCNAFWHQEDDYTLTTKNYIWCYPGKPGVESFESIGVIRDLNEDISSYSGICSDYVEVYRDQARTL